MLHIHYSHITLLATKKYLHTSNFFLEREFRIKSGKRRYLTTFRPEWHKFWNYALLQAMHSICSKSLLKYHRVPSMEGRLEIQKNKGI